MTKTHFFSAVLLFCFLLSFAQEKEIDTVFLFDNQLNNSRKFQIISKLNEKDLLKNTTNLSEILRFQSPVYIKENGRGMVSSPSFRGTTAQQTAFIWNGININSVFLGQGDINNLNLLGNDNMEIKSGGASVIYGSSAIGGTIHLNNELLFNKGFQNTIFFEYGSFKTTNTFLKSSYSNEKLSVKFSGNYTESENDYEVPEKKYVNSNGQYENKTFNLGIAYKLNPQNTIAWQTQLYDGTQNYPTPQFGTKTKYLSNTFRSLLNWNFHSKKVKNILRLAFLEEEFQYFQNSNLPKSSGGTGRNYIVKNDFNYFFNDKMGFNFISDYQLNKGEGYQSGIKNIRRNAGSVAGLFRWNPNQKFYLEAGAKKDFIENTNTPFLFSFSGKYNATNWYSVILNISKNFRNPSFNDLYWEPGGNLDLKSETSHQAELISNFKYKNFKLNLTPYYIKIDDMIQWLRNPKGYYSPVNTHKVESFGLESQLNFEKKFGKNKAAFSLGYVFTHSKNLETDKFLMYVPRHKFFGNASYRYDFAEIFFQGMCNGLTYTTTDEKLSTAIQPYFVLNSGLYFTVFKQYQLGLKINNIFDKIYETMAFFPLPKRNYTMNLLIIF